MMLYKQEKKQAVNFANPTVIRPKYEQLKSHLLDGLANGRYTPGKRIPSENVLAKEMGVARSTVRQAFDQLEQDGLIKRIRGKGTFVATERDRKVAKQLAMFAFVTPAYENDYPIVRGIEDGAHKYNHRLVICSTSNDIEKQGNIILQLIHKNIAGVTIAPTIFPPTPEYHILQLQSNYIPVVFSCRSVDGVSAPLVTWDWKQVGRMAARAFVERGHCKIGYCAVYRYSLTEGYEDGFREELSRHGIPLYDKNIFYGPSPGEEGFEQYDKLAFYALQSKDRPSAIFCSNHIVAEQLFYAAMQMGIKVPDELSIIHFGPKSLSGVIKKKLCLIAIDEYEMGVKVVEILYEMREGKRPIDDNEKILMPLHLEERQTLARCSRQ